MNFYEELGRQLLAGSLSLECFSEKLAARHISNRPDSHHLGVDPEFDLDFDRSRRCGFPEVVYGEGKTGEQIVRIFYEQQKSGIDCLATRISPEKAHFLCREFPGGRYNDMARTFRLPLSDSETNDEDRGQVAIITAGTSDLPIAEEAKETAMWTGANVRMIHDVGVAGPQRLRARFPDFRSADAIVVVAGMEGALPSVVGGYVAVPVIGVPTSIGYGANFGGLAALLGMLNSCASNVTVVNIDAGFKGGYLAGLFARQVATARNGSKTEI